MNDLQLYFESNDKRLIHKWTHYFEIYDRHFSRFRNANICILEIGVYHGGSLQMWRNYFGPSAKIIGVDIDPRCRELEEEGIEIIIGDQEDRAFLASLREKLPSVDILIDDGGHTMRQQIVTFEELFPLVKENGVYLCEDLHTSYWREYGGGFRNPNSFIEYSKAFIDQINAWHSCDPGSFRVNDFTRSAYALHFYTSVLVIDKKSIAPPVDCMTGHLSFTDDNAEQFIKQFEAGQPLLKCELHKPPESLHAMVADLNAKYAETADLQQRTQEHAQNLEFLLDNSQTHARNLEFLLEQSQTHAQNLEAALSESQTHAQNLVLLLQNAKAEQAQTQAQYQLHLKQIETSLQNVTEELEQTRKHSEEIEFDREVLRFRAARFQHKLTQVRQRLKNAQTQLDESKGRVAAMETSKFWKLRAKWFGLKQRFGIKGD